MLLHAKIKVEKSVGKYLQTFPQKNLGVVLEYIIVIFCILHAVHFYNWKLK